MRISRPQMMMEIAHVVAKRATCQRLSVGAVIVRERSILSIGYNGVKAGQPHCLGNDCPGRLSCDLTIHAEINAIHHLPSGTKGSLDLYVTDSPCEHCYNYIRFDDRIDRIFFGTPYRLNEHLVNNDFGPEIYRVTPSGYITDWRTRLLVEVET